jgi:hypothetical protein
MALGAPARAGASLLQWCRGAQMTWNLAVECAVGALAIAATVLAVWIVKYCLAIYRVVTSVDRRPARPGEGANLTPPEPGDHGGPKSSSAGAAKRCGRSE